jgi:flavin reductase (DIM6/NTAB) family NADH-FMN oxidoreductase RutF
MLRESFLEGMSRAATTVNVVTTDGPGGRAGVTVSAMSSVSADRPALLVCVHQASPACQAIKENRRLCVNVLRAEQAAISDRFAGRAKSGGRDKFAGARWRRLATGAPALEDALVAFDCTVMHEVDWDTHTIFIAEVVEVELAQSGSPLIYADRTYGRPLLRQAAEAAA